MITFKEFLNKTYLTEEQQKIISEKKDSPYVKNIWKAYRTIYDTLYKLQIDLSKGFTGGKNKESDKAIELLYNITDKILKGKDLNFITFSKAIEKISI